MRNKPIFKITFLYHPALKYCASKFNAPSVTSVTMETQWHFTDVKPGATCLHVHMITHLHSNFSSSFHLSLLSCLAHIHHFFLLPRSYYVLTITSLKVCTTYAGYKLWELCRRYSREISQSICGNKGKKLCWNTSMYCFMNNPGSTRNCQKVVCLTVYIYYMNHL